MEKQAQLNEKSKRDKSLQEQDSLQYNCQDLDQEQNVDVKPLQFNTQNFNAYIVDEQKDYSGIITGVTYIEQSEEILPKVSIELFFGNENDFPVFKTESDQNGNYIIDNIPPGYYTMKGNEGEYLTCKYRCIKVLPCQTVYLPIFLRRTEENHSSSGVRDDWSKGYRKADNRNRNNDKFYIKGWW